MTVSTVATHTTDIAPRSVAIGAYLLIKEQTRSVKGMCRKLGFDRTLLYHWRNGVRPMPVARAEQLATELKTDVAYLDYIGSKAIAKGEFSLGDAE